MPLPPHHFLLYWNSEWFNLSVAGLPRLKGCLFKYSVLELKIFLPIMAQNFFLELHVKRSPMNLVAKCFLRCWLDISFPPLGLLVFIGTVFTDSDLDHIFPNLLSCYFEFFHRCADLVVMCWLTRWQQWRLGARAEVGRQYRDSRHWVSRSRALLVSSCLLTCLNKVTDTSILLVVEVCLFAFMLWHCLQCINTVGWASGKASWL